MNSLSSKPTISTTSVGPLWRRRLRHKLTITLPAHDVASAAVRLMVDELSALLSQREKTDAVEVEFNGPVDALKYAFEVFVAALKKQPGLQEWLFEEVPECSLTFEDPETGWERAYEYCTKDGERLRVSIEPGDESDYAPVAPTPSATGELAPLVIRDDDPEFVAATAEARRRLPDFLELLKSPQAGVTVRVPYLHEGVRQMYNAALVGKDGDALQVEISVDDATPPVRATFQLNEIDDWTVHLANGQCTGGFVTRAMLRRSRAHYRTLPPQLEAVERSFSEMIDAERYGPK